MPTRLRRIKSWDHGSPFSNFFHDLVDDACGASARFEELEPELLRVIKTPGLDEGGVGVKASVVRATITAVTPGNPNATYDVESSSGTYIIEGATPINRWTDYRFLPASVDDECQLHIDVETGEAVGAVIWETPDSKVC